MSSSVAIAISHTPWIAERVASMARLEASLGLGSLMLPFGCADYRRITERAANCVWSANMWQWGIEQRCLASHCVFLQDDVIAAPNFWPALRAMLAAVPDQVIGLEAVHPGGRTIAREGGRWYTTADGLIGVGYVFPLDLLEDFLMWRALALKPGAVEAISEDQLIDVWAIATGRRIWHPVPTIIDHDLSLASTYGNDEHQHRRPSVTWRDGDVCNWALRHLEQTDFWTPHVVPHLGRFYPTITREAVIHTQDFTLDQAKLSDRDACPPRFARYLR